MLYEIPVENLKSLEKKVQRIRNKGVDVVFDVLGTKKVEIDTNVFHDFYEVEADGEYKIGGWEFVGTIEHTPNGNVIRKINDTYNVPSRYRNAPPECEHCHKIRDRKDTYLVYNSDSDEYKQVGKSCLMGYTNGLSVNVCAELLSFIGEVEGAENFTHSTDFSYGSDNDILADYFKKVAYPFVKKNGYVKTSQGEHSTVRQLSYEMMKRDVELATDEEINGITKWIDSWDEGRINDYQENARILWKKKYLSYRDLGLVSSFIASYFRAMQREAELKLRRENSTDEYVGNIGDKISLEVADQRVLYTKEPYSYYGDYSYVYRILGTDGNIYIWSTTQNVEVGDKIVATIKDHSEFNGEKQNTITRGKITQSNVKNNNNLDNSIEDAMDLFYDED